MTVFPDRCSSSVALSIVVVNWNSGPYLGRLLDSLTAHPPSCGFDVTVVDNGSTDASAAACCGDRAIVITNPHNRGLAAANNQGMAASTGENILLCNPDVELTQGAVDELVAVMERHPRAAFVVPRLRDPDGRPQVSAGDLPTLQEALLGRMAGRGRARRTIGSPAGYWWHGWPHDEERQIGRGAEACYLVRRAALDAFGPQDERFRLDWEGTEWTARARRAGWEVWLAPEAEVVHTGGVSISQVPFRWVWQSHVGMYRYFAATRDRRVRLGLALLVTARAVVKSIGVALQLPLYRWAR